ncbi:LOW QUALITY PROTEIN: CG31911-PA, related [Eimeria mitis]|uniref:CG31911-PA, related n=1 Tax=Eimeria mitis TaxID=44415 RepID=U6JV65_9EIME|nr:LOW QUALITY PROTEIN: CG31911-PA, related [Eimeria mitis]CDJ28676.1 CG31911-PA, related [Eimeria mitis]
MSKGGKEAVEPAGALSVCTPKTEAFSTCLEMQEKGAITERTSGVSTTDKCMISRCEWWITTTAFFFLGMSSLFAWNNVLYLLPYVTEHFLDGYDAGNSLLGVFQVGNLTVQVLLMFVGTVRERWLHLGLFLGSIMCGVFGPCVIYGSVQTRIALVHVLCFLLGSGSGFVQGSGFSYGAIMPVNQVGVYSAGQGFGAIFSVVLVGILSYTVVDIEIQKDVETLVNVTAGVSAAVGVVCILLMATSIRQAGAKRAVAEALAEGNNKKHKSADGVQGSASSPTELQEVSVSSAVPGASTEPVEEKRNALLIVLRQSGVQIACVFLLFFVTCNLFPRVGPLQWDTSNPPKNHLVWLLGVFPFGDTLGKCLCAYAEQGRLFKGFVLFSPRLMPWLTVLRFGLYIPFFLSKHLHENAVFNAFWFQIILMVVLSVTHGWFATLAFIYSVDAVPNMADRKHVGPVAIVSLILGILSGLYFALLYR